MNPPSSRRRHVYARSGSDGSMVARMQSHFTTRSINSCNGARRLCCAGVWWTYSINISIVYSFVPRESNSQTVTNKTCGRHDGPLTVSGERLQAKGEPNGG